MWLNPGTRKYICMYINAFADGVMWLFCLDDFLQKKILAVAQLKITGAHLE